MKNKLQEHSALFFHFVFLMVSLCAIVASLAVCGIAALHDGNVSMTVTAVYALLFFSASVLVYCRFTKKHYGLFLSLLLCFVFRLVFVCVMKREPFSDFRLYHGMASAIANGQTLFSQYGAVFPHTVGFSWMISLVYRLFGENPVYIQLLNVLAETLTAYLLYLSARQLFGSRVGVLTAFLYGISPAFIFYSELSATEIPFTLLLSLLLYLTIMYTKKQKLWYAILFGIIAAVGNAIRPMGLLLLLVFGLYSVCFLSGKRRFFGASAVVLCYLLVWGIFWQGISFVNGQEAAKTPMGYNLYIGANYEYSGKWNAADYAYANELIYGENLSPDVFHQTLQQEAVLRYQKNGIRKNLELFLQKFSVLWGSEMLPCDYLNRSGEFARVDAVLHTKNIANGFHWFLLLSAFLGSILKKKSYKTGMFFIILFVLGLTAQHLIAEVQERYSYPALALLMCVSAYGITRCYEKGAKLFVQATSGRYQSGDGERPCR